MQERSVDQEELVLTWRVLVGAEEKTLNMYRINWDIFVQDTLNDFKSATLRFLIAHIN